MDFRISFSKAAVHLGRALAALLIGLGIAMVLPTKLVGAAYYVDAQGHPISVLRSLYEPTPLTTYAACGLTALLIYAAFALSWPGPAAGGGRHRAA